MACSKELLGAKSLAGVGGGGVGKVGKMREAGTRALGLECQDKGFVVGLYPETCGKRWNHQVT